MDDAALVKVCRKAMHDVPHPGLTAQPHELILYYERREVAGLRAVSADAIEDACEQAEDYRQSPNLNSPEWLLGARAAIGWVAQIGNSSYGSGEPTMAELYPDRISADPESCIDAARPAGEVAGLTDDQLAQAIADPGSIVGRKDPDETVTRWGVRAIRALQWTISHPDTGETT